MKNNYLISVIIPVYNAEKWLDRLLKSLESQTVFDKLEIIFINDGSKDNSLNLLKEFKSLYKNVYIIDKKNTGVSDSRNKGILKATSDYIAFIDADDYIEPDFFQDYINELSDNYDLIVRGFYADYSNGKTIEKINTRKFINNNEEIMKQFLTGKLDPNCWNKLYKRKIISKIKFDTNLKYGEDKDLLFNYIRNINSFLRIEKSGYHYFINVESVMRNQSKRTDFNSINKLDERNEIIKKDYPNLINYSTSSSIDAKTRTLANLVEFKLIENNKELYNKLKKDIREYKIFDKYKYSDRKHFLAFLLIKISPKLYIFFKNKLKLQYK